MDDHSVDASIFKPGGWVLDAGCRDWRFTVEVAARGMKVLAMDPCTSVHQPTDDRVHFLREAIVGDERERVLYAGWSSGEGNRVCREGEHAPHYATTSAWVPAIGLADLMRREDIDFFELVKLDVEGSEYDILLNWPGPVARQISVEFHDFDGLSPMPRNQKVWHRKMLAHLGRWYDVVSHERTRSYSGILNYWDSLFVLRDGMGEASARAALRRRTAWR